MEYPDTRIGIELEMDRVRDVLERVVEPGLPLVAEFGVDAEQDGRDEHDDEQAVPGPGSGGQRAEAASVAPAGLAPTGSARLAAPKAHATGPQALPSSRTLLCWVDDPDNEQAAGPGALVPAYGNIRRPRTERARALRVATLG